MAQKPKRFWLAALLAGWLCDFLFWNKPVGISFFIWVAVLLVTGFILASLEGRKPARLSWLLAIVILVFASVPAWKGLQFVSALSILFSLGGMILLAGSFIDGSWPWYRIRDYVTQFFQVIFSGFTGAVQMSSQQRVADPAVDGERKSTLKRILPTLRGILLALPIVAVLAVLLASADPVFGDWIKRILNLEKLPEYLFRGFYILLLAGFLVGIYLRSIYPTHRVGKQNPNIPWLKTFLGWTETGIILGAVNLLFIVFVIIQVRYLFGGETNINETGYTYADYARRGFGELVAVAVLSLLLYTTLGAVSRKDSKTARYGFSGLSVLLMANVLVILGSSLQRLMLYEKAYGFSQLRSYTHIFIFWLAALIVVMIVLELIRRRGHFGLVLLVTLVGFAMTMALFNTDGFIVEQNMNRAGAGEEVDVWYFNSLSSDALPEMLRQYQAQPSQGQLREDLGAVLACRQKMTNDPATNPWQSTNISRNREFKLLQENAGLWSSYKVALENGSWMIEKDGEMIPCDQIPWMD